MSLKIAIIGTGEVAADLAGAILRRGKAAVKFGTRDPSSEKVQALLSRISGATAASVSDAASWGSAIIIAVPGMLDVAAYKAFATTLGEGANGKVSSRTLEFLFLLV
jgi:pyrroline-5-carboxylate reductase